MKKKRILWGAGALVLVAAPAAIGLWGNASFAESVPVRVPASGQVVTPTPTLSSTPSPSATPFDDNGDDSVDDNGGDVPRDQRVEPGDDRDVQGVVPAPTQSSDDHGSDDRGGDDHGGHGGDDRGGDDHGGHGGDD